MTTTKERTSQYLINYFEIWNLQKADEETGAEECLKLKTAMTFKHPDDPSPVILQTPIVNRGQGIAGSAWLQEQPVILQGRPCAELDATGEAAQLDDLKSLVAIPIYCDFELVGVVVFGLGAGNGGLEIWSRDDWDSLSVNGSFYRGLKSFEFISQYVRFPKGAGLPGFCWKFGVPKMIRDPANDHKFIRSFDRDEAKISTCIGMPISRKYGFPAAILLLLSDEKTPFAHGFNIWKIDNDNPNGGRAVTVAEPSQLSITQITTILTLVRGSGSAEFIGEPRLLPPDTQSALAIPFYTHKKIDHIVMFYF